MDHILYFLTTVVGIFTQVFSKKNCATIIIIVKRLTEYGPMYINTHKVQHSVSRMMIYLSFSPKNKPKDIIEG